MSFRHLRTLPVVLVAIVATTLISPSAAHAKPIPEADSSAAPDDHAGYFLGYPSPTFQWHGCTKFSSKATPEPLDPGVPAAATGNKQKKVTWTLEQLTPASAGYTLRWEVAKGWKICGAQIAMRGVMSGADADYAMSAGYTSKATKGSTAAAGPETIKVKLTKKDCRELGIEKKYAGTWSIGAIYNVTVFIKKRK